MAWSRRIWALVRVSVTAIARSTFRTMPFKAVKRTPRSTRLVKRAAAISSKRNASSTILTLIQLRKMTTAMLGIRINNSVLQAVPMTVAAVFYLENNAEVPLMRMLSTRGNA